MSALVSIVTPCYNAEKYLSNTFRSLLSQSHENWEWIVTDDRSIDSSWSILQAIAGKDKRVRIFQNNSNSGASASRNNSLKESRGKYIAFLDADDEWFSKKIERQLRFMQENQASFTCHNYVMMTESGEDVKPVRSEFSTVTQFELRAFNPIATSFVMVKKEVIGELRFDLSLRRRQDWVFWYNILERVGKCYMIPEILGRYRKDSAHSISKNKFKMAQLQWMIYRKYFGLSWAEAMRSLYSYFRYGVTKHYLK